VAKGIDKHKEESLITVSFL